MVGNATTLAPARSIVGAHASICSDGRVTRTRTGGKVAACIGKPMIPWAGESAHAKMCPMPPSVWNEEVSKLRPMLAQLISHRDASLSGARWVFERKYDGIRCL